MTKTKKKFLEKPTTNPLLFQKLDNHILIFRKNISSVFFPDTPSHKPLLSNRGEAELRNIFRLFNWNHEYRKTMIGDVIDTFITIKYKL